MVFLWSVLIFFTTFTFVTYILIKRRYTHWKKKKVTGPEPTFLFGNLGGMIMKQTHMGHHFLSLYKEYKHEPIEPIEKVDSGQIEKLVKGQNEKDLDLDLKMNLDLNLDKELINKIDKKEKISIFQDKDRYDHSFKSIY